jgi:DNA methyltransferase 1-associated protein 1
MADVMDILERGTPAPKKKRLSNDRMRRELYALLSSDGKDAPPIMTTSAVGGYKQNRINFGQRKVRSWKWMQFNPGRKDSNFSLYHWRRSADEGKEYPFASFAKTLTLPTFTASVYQQRLQCDDWSREESEHLFHLCARFDLRFPIIVDRWDRSRFRARTIEDVKKRYYDICNALEPNEGRHRVFDAEHERKRKEQLMKLYNRTAEQVEEEQRLLEELRKIEMRKKEREKKTQDLQKLIIAADTTKSAVKSTSAARASIGRGRKKAPSAAKGPAPAVAESAGIKFPEAKAVGASLRSQRMKLPSAVGQKKSKAIEQLLIELNVDLKPMPTDAICQQFNDLRSDMVLLYELKLALGNTQFELQTLKHQYAAMNPTRPSLEGIEEVTPTVTPTPKPKSVVVAEPLPSVGSVQTIETPPNGSESPRKGGISEVIDVGTTPGTPNRKRRAALEQAMLMKKLKKG